MLHVKKNVTYHMSKSSVIKVLANEPLSLKESAYSQPGLSARGLTGALVQNTYVINAVVLFWDTAEVTTRGV